MIRSLNTPDLGQSHRLRLNTLIRLRWLAIVGQSVAVSSSPTGSNFPLPVSLCFAADRLLGMAEPVADLPLSGDAPAEPACGVRHPDVRCPAAGRAALHDRRADQPVRAADDRAGGDLGDLAAAQADRAARRSVHRHGDACSSSSICRCPGIPARSSPCRSSMSPACGWRCSPPSPSPPSMPFASPRRRACSPMRSPHRTGAAARAASVGARRAGRRRRA